MERIKAIDIHSHYNHGSPYDTKTSEVYSAEIPFLQKEREKIGVEKMAVCSFASVLSDKAVTEENEHCAQLVKDSDFLLQWVVVDPRNENTFKQAEELLKNKKTLGIKIHSPCHGYPLLDYAQEIFSFANGKNTAVLIHPELENLVRTAELAGQYPKMKLIAAHLGELAYVKALLAAQNVYVDTSGNASSRNNIVEYTVQHAGSDRILFGTDTYSCAFQYGRIFFADISKENKENIFYKNAKKLFDI